MSGIALKVLLFLILAGVIFLGVRRIWRDWTGEARRVAEAERKRDLAERKRPDVITLERDKDGTFRPPGRDERSG